MHGFHYVLSLTLVLVIPSCCLDVKVLSSIYTPRAHQAVNSVESNVAAAAVAVEASGAAVDKGNVTFGYGTI